MEHSLSAISSREQMHESVEILILGAGWTFGFLKEICDSEDINWEATSRAGQDDTIQFTFDPESDDPSPYTVLPTASTVLITFPITTEGASERLIRLYAQTHDQAGTDVANRTRFIQLGTSGNWDGKQVKDDPATMPKPIWYDRHSPFTRTPRAEAEEELLAMSSSFPTTVISLAGLWGRKRSPRNWVGKVAPTKEALKAKGSIHLIHGVDVAQAIVAVHRHFDKAQGQRWILTDGRVYDWWDLASSWGSRGLNESMDPFESREYEDTPQPVWVRELMDEEGIRALPRSVELLGRALDSRDFWKTFDLSPVHTLIEGDTNWIAKDTLDSNRLDLWPL